MAPKKMLYAVFFKTLNGSRTSEIERAVYVGAPLDISRLASVAHAFMTTPQLERQVLDTLTNLNPISDEKCLTHF